MARTKAEQQVKEKIARNGDHKPKAQPEPKRAPKRAPKPEPEPELSFEQALRKRLAELKEQRDLYTQQANMQIGMLSGGIEELERILGEVGATKVKS